MTYPPRVQVSGYAEHTELLAGTPAVLAQGGVTLFAFDPSYRGYADWEQRLLANALLAPVAPTASASERRRVDPSRLPAQSPGARPSVVRVDSRDSVALRAAAASSRVPANATLRNDPLSTTLTVPNPNSEAPEQLTWLRPLLAALAARDVQPTLVIA